MKRAPTPDELYQSFLNFCRRLGIMPPPFDKWLKVRERLFKNYHPSIT